MYRVVINTYIGGWLFPFEVYALKVANRHAVSKFIFKNILVNIFALVLTIGEENNKVPKTQTAMFIHEVHITSKPDKL